MTAAYQTDLAYIHDAGFGGFARNSAPSLLTLFRQYSITDGRVVDLGCGSGIWARELADAGHQVIGVDLSPAMIELARRRVPEAQFHVKSFLAFQIPACRAVTALGEVFNYLLDATNSLRSLQQLCRRVFDALTPQGLLVFDVAEPGRCKGLTQRFFEGDDWTCLVEFHRDVAKQQLIRRIVSFRKVGESYRRQEETHIQQLYAAATIAAMLRAIGFRVRQVRSYGDYALRPGSRRLWLGSHENQPDRQPLRIVPPHAGDRLGQGLSVPPLPTDPGRRPVPKVPASTDRPVRGLRGAGRSRPSDFQPRRGDGQTGQRAEGVSHDRNRMADLHRIHADVGIPRRQGQ